MASLARRSGKKVRKTSRKAGKSSKCSGSMIGGEIAESGGAGGEGGDAAIDFRTSSGIGSPLLGSGPGARGLGSPGAVCCRMEGSAPPFRETPYSGSKALQPALYYLHPIRTPPIAEKYVSIG